MFRRLATALSAAMVFGCAAQAAPLELYGRLPTIEDVAISPNGGRIAYVLTKGEERTVAIESLPDRQPVMIAPAGAAKVRGLTWAGDGHLLITASTAKKARDVTGPRREWFMAFDLDLAKRSITSLMQFTGETDAMNVIFGMPEVRTIDGKPFAFVRGEHFVGNQGQFGLFKVDLDTHVSKLVEEGHRGDAYDWIIDPNGVAVAEATYNDRTGWWALLVKDRDREWRRVHTVKAAIETPELVSLGRDGRSILIDVYDETLGTGWRELSMDGGAWGDPIPGEGERGAIVDPADGRLIGSTALVSEETVYTFFDAQDAAVWRAVQKAFPSDLVTLVSWSDDRKKIVVRVDSPQLGPAYALVDLNTGEAIWLGAEYSGMREADISPVKPVRYKAADGLEITAT